MEVDYESQNNARIGHALMMKAFWIVYGLNLTKAIIRIVCTNPFINVFQWYVCIYRNSWAVVEQRVR